MNVKVKYFLWATLFGICLFVWVSILVFPAQFSYFDFHETGQLGDTIGGLTAPFIGVISSILVYLAFKAQVSANRQQYEVIMEDRRRFEADRWYSYNLNQFYEIRNKFYNYEFNYVSLKDDNQTLDLTKSVTYKGMYAYIIMIGALENDIKKKDVDLSELMFATMVSQMIEEILIDLSSLSMRITDKSNVYQLESISLVEIIKEFYLLKNTMIDEYIEVAGEEKKESLQIIWDGIKRNLSIPNRNRDI